MYNRVVPANQNVVHRYSRNNQSLVTLTQLAFIFSTLKDRQRNSPSLFFKQKKDTQRNSPSLFFLNKKKTPRGT